MFGEEMDKKIIFITLLIAVFIFGCIGAKEVPIIENKTKVVSEKVEGVVEQIPTTQAKTEKIIIKYFAYQPNIIKVSPGTTIVWENQDENVLHQIVSGYVENHKGISDELFDSGEISYGESWNYTFTEPGEYPFYSPKHTQMQGIVVVGDWENKTIQIMTPHFVGSIPMHNKKLESLDQIWITFNVVISDGSEISVYDIGNQKPVELVDYGIETSNYLRLKAKFAEPIEPSLYKVSYTEARPEGKFYGQFFFEIEGE